MKFGKRRKDVSPPPYERDKFAASEAPPEAAPDSATARAADQPEAVATAAEEPPPYEATEAVVEGEAVEIPAEAQVSANVPSAAAFQPPMAYPAAPPMPGIAAMPFPAAEAPVAVAASGAEPDHVVPLGAAAETFASGHGQESSPGPAWPEDVQKLAAERPEVVVGAAFVGGILAALILRRLGN